MLAQLVLVGVGCYLIDGSGLDQGADSWGYVFGFVVAAFHGTWPVLATLVCALVASASTSDVTARRAAMTGAGVAAVAGVAGILLGVVAFLTSRNEVATASGLVAGAASLVATLPLLIAFLPSRATA